jgi:hypothetical protein
MSNTSNRKGLVGKVDIIQIDYSQNVGSDEIIFMNKDHLDAYTDKAIEAHTRSELVWILGYEGKDDSLTLKRIKAYAKKHLRNNK